MAYTGVHGYKQARYTWTFSDMPHRHAVFYMGIQRLSIESECPKTSSTPGSLGLGHKRVKNADFACVVRVNQPSARPFLTAEAGEIALLILIASLRSTNSDLTI